MTYQRFQHNTVFLSGAQQIYIDPFLLGDAPEAADLILVTHDHYDHYSPEDIQKLLKPGTLLVAPPSVIEAAKRGGLEVRLCALSAGESTAFDAVTVEAVPAYNEHKPFHPRSAGGVGFVITVDGVRYYVAGDTDCTPEVCAVRCEVAFLPVGGTYTMTAAEAAKAAGCIRPAVAVPTHYGALDSVAGAEAAEEFAALLAGGIECRIF